jgi:hypothetical protein
LQDRDGKISSWSFLPAFQGVLAVSNRHEAKRSWQDIELTRISQRA